jgi:hypothetical protein
MNKGFSQAGSLIFTVSFVVMIFIATYVYFFNEKSDASLVAEAKVEEDAKIQFVHPIYQYSVALPYFWKGKYEILEVGTQTDFWYFEEKSGLRDLLFSIKKQQTGADLSSAGEIKRLGQKGDSWFVLLVPERVSETLSPDNGQMRRDVLSISDSFSFLNKDSNFSVITEALSHSSVSSSSSISFITFENIATQENATTTDFYIWFVRQNFSWEGFRLRDWPLESSPAVVTIDKDKNHVNIKIPRGGSNFILDIKKMFPQSVRTSTVFLETTMDHADMLEKLTNQLNEKVISYFGAVPLLTRAGYIKTISIEHGIMDMESVLVSSVQEATSTTLLGLDKTTTKWIISSSTAPLSLPATNIKNKAGKVIGTTSPQVVSVSEWPSLFNKTSTSTWAKKPFWFETLNGAVIKMYPL